VLVQMQWQLIWNNHKILGQKKLIVSFSGTAVCGFLLPHWSLTSKWCDMSRHRLSFQWASEHYKNATQPAGLVQNGHHQHIIKCNFFCCRDRAEKEVSFIGGGNRVPGENNQPVETHWQTLLHNVVSEYILPERDSN
jgi:hypothetical protein